VRCHEPVLYIEPLYRVTRTYYREKKYRKRCCVYLDNVLKDRREIIAPLNIDINANGASSSKSQINYQRDEEMGINQYFADDKHKNFIDHLILHGDKFSDEEIHDHIYTFVAAGYEKVALQTYYTLLLLAIHVEVQEKVFDEIKKALRHEKISYESLSELSYLDMVIKESMRLLPAVPIIGRETQEEIEIGTRKIPKGIQLMIHLFNLHRRKDIWGEDANQFNPERFSPENEAKRPENCFLPFSTGLRDCIGKQYAIIAIRTIIVKLLRNYKLSADLKTEELTYKADITLKICQDVSMKVQKR
jgi:cytochrome P450